MSETPQSEPVEASGTHSNPGGVSMNAAQDAQVAGDVVGRDKIINVAPGGTVINAGWGIVVACILLGLAGLLAIWRDADPQPPIGSKAISAAISPMAATTALPPRTPSTGEVPSSTKVLSAPMVYVDAGYFTMGSESNKDTRPEHSVKLNAFWIDKFEVTNLSYRLFTEASHYALPALWEEHGYPAGYDDYPIVGVKWDDANAYCAFVGKRLPSEAEWEKAARGTDTRQWPWGNEWSPHRANAENPAKDGTKPVGSYPEGFSPYGAADMAGNVMEWVADYYEPDYYEVSSDYDPLGPPFGDNVVVRGGSAADARELVRSFSRLGIFRKGDSSPALGFRCACTDCGHD